MNCIRRKGDCRRRKSIESSSIRQVIAPMISMLLVEYVGIVMEDCFKQLRGWLLWSGADSIWYGLIF